ncbi:LptF/LptG family permease [Shimia thalassica]|uniref:LptF/LptG family permease n=1 Tax=Shimia thalassica TaxID=1715693 RepID=UPI0027346273|nr:LptF/LptG family permease [Shimia thalassica]MDP2580229.1 LptF/LptG family permease [Shimia thalassica]
MILPGPVFKILGKPLVRRLALLLAMVVGIFLIESFTTLMERALQFGGNPWDVAALLAYKAPEIVDIALALGLLIAFYFALAEARNKGELMILATAGVHWVRVVGFALAVGLVGGAVSYTVAGYVVPRAHFAERIKMAELRTGHVLQQISETGPRNEILNMEQASFIATPPSNTESGLERGPLFIVQTNPDQSWRVIQSYDWTIVKTPSPDVPDGRRIELLSLRAFDGPPPEVAATSNLNVFNTTSADLSFRLQDIAPEPALVAALGENVLRFTREDGRRIASIGARALLVPAAALLAIVAVLAGGSGRSRFFVLPVAIALVMTYDVLGRTLVLDGVDAFAPYVLVVIALSAYLGPALLFIAWRGEAIMIPSRGG